MTVRKSRMHREARIADASRTSTLSLEFQLVEFFLMTEFLTFQPALHEPVDCVTDEFTYLFYKKYEEVTSINYK